MQSVCKKCGGHKQNKFAKCGDPCLPVHTDTPVLTHDNTPVVMEVTTSNDVKEHESAAVSLELTKLEQNNLTFNLFLQKYRARKGTSWNDAVTKARRACPL